MTNPLVRVVARLTMAPLRKLVRPNRRMNAALWNAQYALGLWRFLDGMSDGGMPLSLIARWAPDPTILDLGCGTSANLPLAPGRYRRYHGVDISRRAIDQARAIGRPDTSFEVADIRTFDTPDRFDAILLREVIYYLSESESATLLRRLPGMLTARGRILVQVYDTAQAGELLRLVRSCGLTVAEGLPTRLGPGPSGVFLVLTAPAATAGRGIGDPGDDTARP
ncbi:class I SAM-dependent methyltransferase [Plantactinospora sp. S1510]|uniref:Class I SAM-dependent methyltransferase n=1 Tax=Plantactinospora alkalitolerans TaxID=2789879 RepID=A0ABS0GW17_9ACTN|nr:class I SAM-dependent methyltransferase [Plantactinospora alkalitolerans]MBF9130134.1 class I SAM-dependent methyltransferase [Plantactinospora alkalitolerans]